MKRVSIGWLAGILAGGAASAAIQVSPELELDPPRGEPALWPVSGTGVAFDGARFVVVWSDDRSGTPDVYGAHLPALGTAFTEPRGVRVLSSSQGSAVPSVACGSAGCVLGWATPTSVSAELLDPSLSVLGSAPIALGTAATSGLAPTAASGSSYAVTFTTPDGGVLQGIAPDGGLTFLVPIPGYNPALAFDGSNYVVVWESAPPGTAVQLWAQRVAPDGTLVDAAPVPFPSALAGTAVSVGGAGVAANAGVSIAVWMDANGVEGAAFHDASWLSATPTSLAPFFGTTLPAVGFDGTSFRAVWINPAPPDLDYAGVQIAPDGGALGPSSVILPGPYDELGDPLLGCGSGTCALVTNGRLLGADVPALNVTWLGGAGAFIPQVPIQWPDAGCRQLSPAVACGPHLCLGVWLEQRAAGVFVQARRFTFDGGSAGPSFTLGSTPIFGVPAVAASTAQFAVAWTSNATGGITAARVAEDGTLLDPAGISAPTGFLLNREAQIAFDGAAYVIAGEGPGTLDGGATGFVPLAWRLSVDGDAGAPYPVCAACATQIPLFSPVSVASSGGTTFLAWLGGDGTAINVMAARLDGNGLPLDATPLRVTDSGTALNPTVVAGPGGALVALRLVGVGAVRLDANGTVLDAQPIPLVDGGVVGNLTGAADGPGYLLVYEDDAVMGDAQLRALSVFADGGAAGAPFDVVAGSTNALSPAMASFDGGFFLAYSVYDPSPADQNLRARGRILTEVSAPDAGADAGPGDAAIADAGAAPTQTYRVGCGCNGAGDGAALLAVLAAAAGMLSRRGTSVLSRPEGGPTRMERSKG